MAWCDRTFSIHDRCDGCLVDAIPGGCLSVLLMRHMWRKNDLRQGNPEPFRDRRSKIKRSSCFSKLWLSSIEPSSPHQYNYVFLAFWSIWKWKKWIRRRFCEGHHLGGLLCCGTACTSYLSRRAWRLETPRGCRFVSRGLISSSSPRANCTRRFNVNSERGWLFR